MNIYIYHYINYMKVANHDSNPVPLHPNPLLWSQDHISHKIDVQRVWVNLWKDCLPLGCHVNTMRLAKMTSGRLDSGTSYCPGCHQYVTLPCIDNLTLNLSSGSNSWPPLNQVKVGSSPGFSVFSFPFSRANTSFASEAQKKISENSIDRIRTKFSCLFLL